MQAALCSRGAGARPPRPRKWTRAARPTPASPPGPRPSSPSASASTFGEEGSKARIAALPSPSRRSLPSASFNTLLLYCMDCKEMLHYSTLCIILFDLGIFLCLWRGGDSDLWLWPLHLLVYDSAKKICVYWSL